MGAIRKVVETKPAMVGTCYVGGRVVVLLECGHKVERRRERKSPERRYCGKCGS